MCIRDRCIAGPIVRYKDINAELLQRKASRADISYGVTRFTVGLAKDVYKRQPLS